MVYCAWSFVAVENTCPEMGQTAGLRPKACPPQSPLTNLPHPSHQVYFQFCQGYKAHNLCHTCIPKSWLSCLPSPQELIWHLPTRTHSNHPPLGYRYLWFFSCVQLSREFAFKLRIQDSVRHKRGNPWRQKFPPYWTPENPQPTPVKVWKKWAQT